MGAEALLHSMRSAVEAAPDDIPLRLHLARLLITHGRKDEAIHHAAFVLQREPANADALLLISDSQRIESVVDDRKDASPKAGGETDIEALGHLESELAEIIPPSFVTGAVTDRGSLSAERTGLRMNDVVGMQEVKARLEASFLAPIRNPELVRLYGKSLRGGLLLYGPPGCGKTFIARAVAGEMEAHFISVSLADVLDMFIGQSERNLREIFETARANAPCVIFLDEIDALGQKRSQMRHNAARGTVNQLLDEMDGVARKNDGVYILGATNHPWDVDTALRRPGRFDRMLLVLPPDSDARSGIFRFHLSDRPVSRIDVGALASMTEGYSGADIAHVCETATEFALLDSVASGEVRMITMADIERAVKDVKPSIGPWMATARNVAEFSNTDGTYDDLRDYLRRRRIL